VLRQIDPGHFGLKTLWHHQTGANCQVSGQFNTSAEVSRRHFSPGTELSRPLANIFCYNRLFTRKVNITRYYY